MALPFWPALARYVLDECLAGNGSSFTTNRATLYEPAACRLRSTCGGRKSMDGALPSSSPPSPSSPHDAGRDRGDVRPRTGRGDEGLSQITATADPARRVARRPRDPAVYAGLTVRPVVALLIAGEPNFPALIHALSTVSTSGISATGGLPVEGRPSGRNCHLVRADRRADAQAVAGVLPLRRGRTAAQDPGTSAGRWCCWPSSR